MNLRDLVDSTLSDIRMSANIARQERVSVKVFIDEIALAGSLHAEFRALRFAIDEIDPGLTVNADPQLLASAVMNLLNNAFKFTPAGGTVVLRAGASGERVLIEVEDQCGGIPESGGPVPGRSPNGASTIAAASASASRSPARRSGSTAATSASATCPEPGAYS